MARRSLGVQVKHQVQTRVARMNASEEVARVAYELFERRGCVHGHDLEDWLEAERIVRARQWRQGRR